MVTLRRASVGALLVLLTLGTGCQPEFTQRSSLVTDVRVLGVRSEPAEAEPDPLAPPVVYTALVGDVSGTQTDVPLDWAYCTLPTPVSELNDVSPECFAITAPQIIPFDHPGLTAMASIPFANGVNACNQFGPDVPTPVDGGPPGRPADPDSTGGYYQPVRILLDRGGHLDFTLAQTRIHCNLPGATPDVFGDFKRRYLLNRNPEIASMVATTSALPAVELKTEDQGDSGLIVSPGASVHLTASYAACPALPACGNGFCEASEDKTCPDDCVMTPPGCTGAEGYVYFNLVTGVLDDRREAIRLSWFTNQGSFADDRTGHSEQDADATTTENTWTAPNAPGAVTLWAVLRDSRGGLTWKSYKITVQ